MNKMTSLCTAAVALLLAASPAIAQGSHSGEVKGSNSGEMKGSNAGEMKGSNAGEMKGSNSGEMKGSNAGEMKGSHSGEAMQATADEATASAVINSIDADAGKINVTHEPIPAIGWPKMTMDLPVTKRVDLATVKPGSTVTIKLKLGRDKQYRVVEIMPATN